MAFVIKPAPGETISENWKNTPYIFYTVVQKIQAVTELIVDVYEPAGTISWKFLKEQKTALQNQINKINSKMVLIEAANPVV